MPPHKKRCGRSKALTKVFPNTTTLRKTQGCAYTAVEKNRLGRPGCRVKVGRGRDTHKSKMGKQLSLSPPLLSAFICVSDQEEAHYCSLTKKRRKKDSLNLHLWQFYPVHLMKLSKKMLCIYLRKSFLQWYPCLLTYTTRLA